MQHAPLGAGGSAEVVSAFDQAMGRRVALKLGRRATHEDIARFRHEARLTATLEHPNIVPVYEIGTTDEGDPFYTMRLVSHRSLRAVLNDETLRAKWSLRRRCSALVGICRALDYAHARGLVHGDVKPENILVGDHGEVYLADWELAFTEDESEGALAVELRGTPGYIAPELVSRVGRVDRAADMFAVGVTLYELLTDRHPFEHSTLTATLNAVVDETPESARLVVLDCPLLLDELARALLAKDPAQRPTAAQTIARIDEFLDGAREQERRAAEALRITVEATREAATFERLAQERQALERAARRELEAVKAWAPAAEKREGWAKQKAARDADVASGLALARALAMFAQALGYDPACEDAHRGLARLHWSLARRAEREQRVGDQAHHEALVREHDRGEIADQLTAPATLVVHTVPAGAHVTLAAFVERDRIRVAEQTRPLGTAPVRTALPADTYLLTVEMEGYATVRYPVLLRRGETHAATVRLYTHEEIGEGFVFVPRSNAILGGDPQAVDPLPLREVNVEDFAIGETPVTFRDYCEFLDALHAIDPALAERREPRDQRGSEGRVVYRSPEGRYLPERFLVEGDGVHYLPHGEASLLDLPVLLVDWFDAIAYAKWRSARDGVTYRLPTEHEWEKAARGVDGRCLPWGDEHDASFCKTRDSRPTLHQPEPVGAFATDVSVYGARDMAGGIREWVGDYEGRSSAEALLAEPEPEPGMARGEAPLRQARSGSWNADAQWCRAASRGPLTALTRGTGLGFRLAKSLGRR